MHLYETHLSVKDTERSKTFYTEAVNLHFAHRDPARDIVFLWIGENKASMLGLWGPETSLGKQMHKGHIAIRVTLPELLSMGEQLSKKGVRTYDFNGVNTTEPSVIGWMPSAQLYFLDPDGHSLEFITLLDEKTDPSFIGSYSKWQLKKRGASRDSCI
jgi:lactoylglutathione lyase